MRRPILHLDELERYLAQGGHIVLPSIGKENALLRREGTGYSVRQEKVGTYTGFSNLGDALAALVSLVGYLPEIETED